MISATASAARDGAASSDPPAVPGPAGSGSNPEHDSGPGSVGGLFAAPPTGRPTLIGGAFANLAALWKWRHLVTAFTVTEIRHDKRNNVLGNLWHLLNPILNMLIFTFIVQVVFNSGVENYPVFFFCGIMFFRAWTLAFSRGTAALIQAAGLIKCCYFPRITAVAPVTIKGIYDLAIESLVLIGLMAWYGVVPGWQIVFVFPLIAVTFLGASGAVLLLSTLGARFRDVTNLIQHVNRVFFYFSPVMYPVTLVPDNLRDIYMLNPVACALEIARDVVVRAQTPDVAIVAWYTGFSVGLFVIGLLVFTRLEGRVTKFL